MDPVVWSVDEEKALDGRQTVCVEWSKSLPILIVNRHTNSHSYKPRNVDRGPLTTTTTTTVRGGGRVGGG